MGKEPNAADSFDGIATRWRNPLVAKLLGYTKSDKLTTRRLVPSRLPLCLAVPGSEGIANVKWLGRIKLLDQPNLARMEGR